MGRSITALLKNAPTDKVREWLDTFATKGNGQWYYPPRKLGELGTILLINLTEHPAKEFESDDYADIVKILGYEPSVGIFVDIGKGDGTAESKSFMTSMLKAFSGVALDSYTDHLWTLEDMENDIRIDQLHFFDFKGFAQKMKDGSSS